MRLVLSDQESRVLTLTLNRPEARNAMNAALVEELIEALTEADRDGSVGAIVLTGADPVFCAGADLKEMAGSDPNVSSWRVERSLRMYGMFAELTKPVVGAINGHAVAGGCGLAMACDIVISSEDAEFGYPETQRGLVAALVMVSLSRLVGRRAALEILLSGRRVPASEAKAIGMINEVVAKSQVLTRAKQLASALAGLDPDAIAITKDLFYRVSELPAAAAMDRARAANLLIRHIRAAAASLSADGEPAASNQERPTDE